ncbi:hypothetical protein ACFSS8_01960 [Paracoccus kondratievae]
MSLKPSSLMMREGVLWGSAAVMVLAAHLGGALWILHRAEAATPPGLPEPVFVDLAPMPEAAAPGRSRDNRNRRSRTGTRAGTRARTGTGTGNAHAAHAAA